MLDTDTLPKGLTTDTLKRFEAKYGPVPKALSRLIRPGFVARPDHTLVWGDWSAIEARKLPWLAASPGADAVLDVFRTNDADKSLPDIYRVEAGGIYGKHPTEVDKYERGVGKVAILALGFGGGENALDAMAVGYGLDLDRAFREYIVERWRGRNAWAETFWGQLSDAFFRAWDRPGEVFTAGRVSYVHDPDYLFGTTFCVLPDGRVLTYAALKREKVTIEDPVTAEERTEWKVRYQKGYERGTIWHGILAENITQASAASLLRDLLVRMEHRRRDGSYPGVTVGHTHDEIITEVPWGYRGIAQSHLKTEMEVVPDWAEGLPLVAEVTENWWYTKTLD